MTPHTPYAPPRRRIHPALIGLAAGLAVVGLAIAGYLLLDHRSVTKPASAIAVSASPTHLGYAITGTIDVVGTYPEAGDCAGQNGYDDIRKGAVVSVLDMHGVALATGTLNEGRVVGGRCQFFFMVAGVPAGRGMYQVTAGNGLRPGPTFSEADLAASVELHLG